MLTIYPSNRLEDLATLLMAVIGHIQSQTNHQNILKPQQIIVESRGIRHWLQMELAAQQNIAMNYQFLMPGAFIWSICRKILGEQIPQESLYTEDVLHWRIDSCLAGKEFQNHPASAEVNHYWQADPVDVLKRFQLAGKLASVFQQYMTFRPAWIKCWDEGKTVAELTGNNLLTQQWQAHLWQLLTTQDDGGSALRHPVNIQNRTLAALTRHREKLPAHILLFAINQMPGPTLAFFQALASQPETSVHLFHLNPCVDYWGDLRSDKQRARENRMQSWSCWLGESQLANPLLANLGQQGREFCEAIQEIPDSFEISAFNEVTPTDAECQKDSVLSCLQRDILTLRDGRLDPVVKVDDSIYISSAHSPLREIQALHDYLLHQANLPLQPEQGVGSATSKTSDARLTPGDILVMCPNIEDYAPYVDAIFRRPWHPPQADDSPRWPCSIADRNSLDEEPLVSAFMDLLSLPDSRFEVSSILDFLRLAAIQKKFGFTQGELDTIEWWLREACIHWGVDAENKKHHAGLEQASGAFTWLWGLERLLLGFAYGDSEHISANRLLLPHVEGQYALLLGRLRYFVEQLRQHAKDLGIARQGEDWQSYLQAMKEALFAPGDEDSEASLIIDHAISQLGEALRLSCYAHPVDYRVIRASLQGALSRPDTGNHYMVGQVTFCSMIPMRSVPFRIIAVLGLNNSDFPRQDRRVSFDLMAHAHHKGDRSRRADDRYLFLETLISAREKLYLSFQGRAVKDNQPRQPSLVLKELMHYLEKAYGWQLTGDQATDLHQQPLHPFSPACYPMLQAGPLPAASTESAQSLEVLVATPVKDHQTLPSFAKNWCRLVSPATTRKNYALQLNPFVPPDDLIEIETLVRFFDDPLKALARERLGLFLDDKETALADTEPFALDSLTQYLIRSDLCEARLNQQAVETTLNRYTLSGKLPESPITKVTTHKLDAESQAIYQQILALQMDIEKPLANEHLVDPQIMVRQTVEKQNVELNVDGLRLVAELTWLKKDQRLLNYRAATCKPKDRLRLWITHLVGSAVAGGELTTTGVFLNDKKSGATTMTLPVLPAGQTATDLLKALLDAWKYGLSQPAMLHASLGCKLDGLSEGNWRYAVADKLEDNVYFHWFYGSAAEREASSEPSVSHLARLCALYTPLNELWQGVTS